MKIAIDVTPILPGGECGGVKQLVLALLKGFGERAAYDNFILLTSFYNHDMFKEYEKCGMQRICIRKESSPDIKKRILSRARMKIKSYFGHGVLRENDISVLFCPMTAPTYHETGIPTVSIVCDLQHLYYPTFFSAAELGHRNNFYSQFKKRVDYVISISEYTKKSIVEKLSFPDGKVFSIPICVQSRLAIPSPELTASVLGEFSLTGKKYCIYPANLWPHKNHKILFTAFNMFTKQYLNYDLHLVLTGAKIENNKIIDDAVKQMGLGEKVHFMGYLAEEELSAIWHGSHFLIFPSLFEGFGIPLVEAMMYGKPILASNVTSIPEVAGNAAIYFDPRKPDEIVDALKRLMESEELYNNLVHEGQKQLMKFDFNDMVDQYITTLHKAGGQN